MAQKKPSTPPAKSTFKVRLDERTVITLNSKESLEFWKKRYPDAKVIEQN